MKDQEIKQMIESAGFPVTYHHFEVGEEPETPYAIYLYPGTNNFAADGVVYQTISKLDIELYTDHKDFEAEKKLEAVLKEHGFFFEKTEGYLESEEMFEVLYEMEVLIDE
jgi:hypothetical protein|nr:MAG TPA: tail completion protein [Caudoviricetes sp.]